MWKARWAKGQHLRFSCRLNEFDGFVELKVRINIQRTNIDDVVKSKIYHRTWREQK